MTVDVFDRLNIEPDQDQSSKSLDIFEKIPAPEEGFWKSAFRYAAQIPLGLANVSPYGIATNLSNLLAIGDVLDPEEMERIKEISEREGIPFDEESYMKAGHEALNSFPTPSNIARSVEEKTGIPLTPKTRGQKALGFATEATKLAPSNYTLRGMNTSLPKPILGSAVAGTKELLTEAGVPEGISDLASFAILKKPTKGSGKISIGEKTKPSGLKERRFEDIVEPTEISAKAHQKINEKLESDFKNISDEIISKTPIEETRATLKENPAFKKEVGEQFEVVQKLADELPEKISTKSLKKNLADSLQKSKESGLLESEYQQDFNKFISEYIKKTPENSSAGQLVKQFRENNKSLSEYYDPSRTKAYNRAKKDALLEYNKSISKVIESEYPNTEFSKLFPETNKKWSQINDSESINGFIEDLFNGEINYKQANKFFKNENLSRPFKRALGKEGFNNFEQLMKDLLKSETPYKMLKVAEKKGYADLFQHGLAYVISPKLGTAKTGFEAIKSIRKGVMNALIDKPKLVLTWKKGVDHLKKGEFLKSDIEFEKINKEIINYE